MKKVVLSITILCAVAFGFTSCKPELKSARVQVKSMEIINDSLKSMVVALGDEEKTVTLLDARFQNGIAIQGDSVILDYIDGKGNTLRGLVVTVLPRATRYFEPSDTLVTRVTKDSIQ